MQFIQSIHDFPQFIKLGDKMPSFGLNRFKQRLQFVPTDDEGFSLRGNRQQLLYKGRRRSHRFTILGDSAFEYDCILLKEPDTNIIRLRIEGAEQYDFFRQPDFVQDPFLKGSYAVYKKETLIGEGTGKLCHIHRPEIIDARGRRCWGGLAVVGNELLITIPEQWLSEAAYPVVVDPVMGTDTVGSLVYYDEDEHYNDVFLRDEIVLNKILISENIDSIGTFYVYKNGNISGLRAERTYPCIYNHANYKPHTKISSNEQQIIDNYANQARWLQGNLNKNSPIYNGDYIWLGVRGAYLSLRFDYGGISEIANVYYSYFSLNTLLPNVLGDINSRFITTQYNYMLRISMYLTYLGEGNNYSKTLVETARVDDSISKVQTFLRFCVNTARINMALNVSRIAAKICHIIDNLRVNDTISKVQSFFRKCVENGRITATLNALQILPKISHIIDSVRASTKVFSSRGIFIKVTDLLKAEGTVTKKLFISLTIKTNSFIRSYIIKRFLNSKVEITIKSRIGESNRNEE